MKKLFAILLCVVLLCAPVFAANAAQKVQDVFTAPTAQEEYVGSKLVLEGAYFTLTIHTPGDDWVTADKQGFLIATTPINMLQYTTIEAAPGYVIDEIIIPVFYNGLPEDPIKFSAGKPSQISGDAARKNAVADITGVNATRVKISRGEPSYFQSKEITVIGHRGVPATGDTARLPILIAAALISALVLTAVTLRRRRRV